MSNTKTDDWSNVKDNYSMRKKKKKKKIPLYHKYYLMRVEICPSCWWLKIITFNHGHLALDFVDFICLLCVAPKIQTTCSFIQDKEPQTRKGPYLTPCRWNGISASTSLKSTEFRLISLVDNSFKMPGVALRNVEITAFGSPSTVTWVDKVLTACTINIKRKNIEKINDTSCDLKEKVSPLTLWHCKT